MRRVQLVRRSRGKHRWGRLGRHVVVCGLLLEVLLLRVVLELELLLLLLVVLEGLMVLLVLVRMHGGGKHQVKGGQRTRRGDSGGGGGRKVRVCSGWVPHFFIGRWV